MSCYVLLCYVMYYKDVKILRVVVDILWSFRPDKSCRSLEFLVQLQGGAGVPKGFDSPLVSLDLCKKWGKPPALGWPDDRMTLYMDCIEFADFPSHSPYWSCHCFGGILHFHIDRDVMPDGVGVPDSAFARHCFWEQQGKLDRGRGHVNKYSIASGNCYTKG